MADGVPITPGVGVTVASDDCGAAGHAQIVKLAVSANGDATPISATAADGVLVNLGTNNDVTITSGTITTVTTVTTVSAVTSLSQFGGQAITLGAGAVGAGTLRLTLAADDPAVGALQILDDWDESDRAKVNVIVGQAGITAGAGAVAANTPRATLASDDPAVAALQVMDDWDESDRAKVNAQEVSGVMIENAVPVTVKRAIIDVASSGDNTLVAAVGGKKIRVLSLVLVSAGTVTVRFESGAGGTALTGQMSLVANSGFSLSHNPHGWFETADNTLLNIELSGAVSVDGCLTYIEAE